MAEVARIEEKKLGTLADRINEEHRACVAAVGAALGHALEAGRLLEEVKASLPHGDFGTWLKEHFVASDRTARVYMRLYSHREELEAKRQSSATLSIDEALKMLRAPQKPDPTDGVPGATPRTPEQQRRELAKARREQKLLERAEFALRIGDHEPPPDVDDKTRGAWPLWLYKAQRERGKNLPNVLDRVAHQLHILVQRAPPEQVGRYLTEQRVGSEEEENRAEILAELRAGVAWLQQVLDQVDQEQARIQADE